MDGRSSGVDGAWDDDLPRGLGHLDTVGAGSEGEEADEGDGDGAKGKRDEEGRSRHGKWESGKGRCAVTGRRVLGGTDGLRRVMV